MSKVKNLLRPVKRYILSFYLPLRRGLDSVKGFSFVSRKKGGSSPCVVFIPTNGAGLGHLSRCIAVARVVRKRVPNVKIVFFTSSIALPLLAREGFTAFHIPPRLADPEILSASAWNQLFESSLGDVIRLYKPMVAVFDGTYPYDGLRNALRRYKATQTVWMKRGLYKSASIDKNVAVFTKEFDNILVPGEMGEGKSTSVEKNMKIVSPIVLGDYDDLLTRVEACDILQIDSNLPVIYVQLGAGNINDANSLLQKVLATLKDIRDIQIVVGESPIAENRVPPSRDYKVISDYPNSRFFNAFDVAILAAGYNSVYEALYYSLPAIFYPNLETSSDDQVYRAKIAESQGKAVAFVEFDAPKLQEAVAELLEFSNRQRPCGSTAIINGAHQAADEIRKMLIEQSS